MDDKATKRCGGAVVVLVVVCVLAVLSMLYVLSIGPVVAMFNKGWIEQSWAHTIENAYLPIDWTAYMMPGGDETLSMYLRWWEWSVPSAPAGW